MAAWLDSLPSSAEGEKEATPDEEGLNTQSDAQEISWLEASGFTHEEVTQALAEVDDEDEAFALLKRRRDKELEAPPAKRRRGFEIDGYWCTADASRIRLVLPDLDLDGPVVGRVRADGSMTVDIDEWVQELYFASLPRAAPCQFQAEAADKALAEDRPWIWENFASHEEVLQAHEELEQLRTQGILTSANSDTTGRQKARSDKVAFLELRDERPTACLKLFGRMEAAASKLSWSDGGPLLCPKFGMAAVYDGGGSFYAPHRDNEKGFGQRPWVNFRSLTAVIYVNPCGFEKAEEGGQLRCFHHCRPTDLTGATARKVEDVHPLGGRAVLFPSRTLLHEVLPSHRRRYALTLWFVSPGAGGT